MEQQPIKTNGLAIASLVLGIIAFLTGIIFIGSVLGVLAIIFGIISLRKGSSKPLAITGIITGLLGIVGSLLAIVLVLIAVPALERNQRDTSRKSEVGLIVTEIVSYQTNNRGALPNPSDVAGTLKTAKLDVVVEGEPTTSTAVYQIGADCDGVSSSRAFTVTTKLENGQLYCHGS